jgi:hypothetical protein
MELSNCKKTSTRSGRNFLMSLGSRFSTRLVREMQVIDAHKDDNPERK